MHVGAVKCEVLSPQTQGLNRNQALVPYFFLETLNDIFSESCFDNKVSFSDASNNLNWPF